MRKDLLPSLQFSNALRGVPACAGCADLPRQRPPQGDFNDRSGGEMPKHVLQDAAVLEVLELIESIDPTDQRHAFQRSVRGDDLSDQALMRFEVAMQSPDRDRFAAF